MKEKKFVPYVEPENTSYMEYEVLGRTVRKGVGLMSILLEELKDARVIQKKFLKRKNILRMRCPIHKKN